MDQANGELIVPHFNCNSKVTPLQDKQILVESECPVNTQYITHLKNHGANNSCPMWSTCQCQILSDLFTYSHYRSNIFLLIVDAFSSLHHFFLLYVIFKCLAEARNLKLCPLLSTKLRAIHNEKIYSCFLLSVFGICRASQDFQAATLSSAQELPLVIQSFYVPYHLGWCQESSLRASFSAQQVAIEHVSVCVGHSSKFHS